MGWEVGTTNADTEKESAAAEAAISARGENFMVGSARWAGISDGIVIGMFSFPPSCETFSAYIRHHDMSNCVLGRPVLDADFIRWMGVRNYRSSQRGQQR